MFWAPACCPSVIPAIGLRASPFPRAEPFRPWEAPSRVQIFADETCRQHVRVRRDLQSSQLVVSGVCVLDAPYLLTELSSPAFAGGARLAAIGAFNRLGHPDRGRHSPDTAAARWRLVLQALDGALSGLSQREIAIGLFGGRNVAAEWRDGGGHLRDRVRRAVGRGRHMMASGYLNLLRG